MRSFNLYYICYQSTVWSTEQAALTLCSLAGIFPVWQVVVIVESAEQTALAE